MPSRCSQGELAQADSRYRIGDKSNSCLSSPSSRALFIIGRLDLCTSRSLFSTQDLRHPSPQLGCQKTVSTLTLAVRCPPTALSRLPSRQGRPAAIHGTVPEGSDGTTLDGRTPSSATWRLTSVTVVEIGTMWGAAGANNPPPQRSTLAPLPYETWFFAATPSLPRNKSQVTMGAKEAFASIVSSRSPRRSPWLSALRFPETRFWQPSSCYGAWTWRSSRSGGVFAWCPMSSQ
jgi:hypothetical protein